MTGLAAVLVALAVLLVAAPAPPLPLQSRAPGPVVRPAPPLTMPDVSDTLDLLALALRGGAGIVQAIDAVADRVGPPASDQLRRVSAALRWGVEDSRAWSAVPAAWQPAARALHLAATAGAAPADLLHLAAGDLRRTEAARLEVAAPPGSGPGWCCRSAWRSCPRSPSRRWPRSSSPSPTRSWAHEARFTPDPGTHDEGEHA